MYAAGVTGRAFVRFEFDPLGKPIKFALLTPPDKPGAALNQAAQASAQRLRDQMPAWQLPPPGPAASPRKEPLAEIVLLEFGADPAQQPWPYADIEPDFSALKAHLPPATLQYLTSQGLTYLLLLSAFTQRLTKYPPAALRSGEQGRGYAYFEVSETGAVERLAIAGSIGPNLDLEIGQALRQIPAASSPALRQGRPVRVYYVLPMNFKIQ